MITDHGPRRPAGFALTMEIVAQCAHAAVDVVRCPAVALLERWRAGGARKIVLGVDDLAAMTHRASLSGRDAMQPPSPMRVERIPAGTVTVLGIMGPRRAMDALLRHLKRCEVNRWGCVRSSSTHGSFAVDFTG